jgi:hypothetical protein
VFVESGDGGGADGGQGGSAGGVIVGLYNSALTANGKAASIVVQGGSGGFGRCATQSFSFSRFSFFLSLID